MPRPRSVARHKGVDVLASGPHPIHGRPIARPSFLNFPQQQIQKKCIFITAICPYFGFVAKHQRLIGKLELYDGGGASGWKRTTPLEDPMRKALMMVATSLGVLLSKPVVSLAQTPDASIELSGGSVAAGIGYGWGHGTLIFKGRRYPVAVSGLSLASVGVAGYSAAGNVYGLRSLQDVNGVYASVAAEGTLVGGAGATAMENQNGVVINMTSTTEGLNLTLAAEGMKIALGE
jgi:hypothetical protein